MSKHVSQDAADMAPKLYPNLEHYVEDLNRCSKLFSRIPCEYNIRSLTAEQKRKILEAVETELSPENLSCDGELPQRQVDERYDYLTKVRDELHRIRPTR